MYQGGEVEIALAKTESILFLGPSGVLPIAFLDDASRHGVAITIHRTHDATPYLFSPASKPDRDDLLGAQIRTRDDGRLRLYIARALVRARFAAAHWQLTLPDGQLTAIRQSKTIEQLRRAEAQASALYWRTYFAAAGCEGVDRRSDHALSKALDGASHFLAGTVHRWISGHGLSPWHGYLHEPTSYPSLVYDLLEPLRHFVDQAAFKAWHASRDEESMAARTIDELKRLLATKVWVPATRQHVYGRALIQGQVLALRAFLLNASMRYSPPIDGKRTAGRPQKGGYRLVGEIR